MAFRKKTAPPPPPPPRTLFEKIWDNHVVSRQADGTCVIYVDRHLVHEVTSPQAFEGLRMAGRPVRRPDATVAVADHNTPTKDLDKGITDEESRIQVETLEKNVAEFGVPYFGMEDPRRGIVHVIGPEQGLTLPGMTIVCGDSHTSTHGALGALAFGIGTSEVEHVLATQTLIQRPAKNMRVAVEGNLPLGVTAKDVILAIIGKLGTAGGTGYVIEYAGRAIREMTMEGRMTVCNMSIEAGARAGLIAPDETTFQYLHGRPYAPKGGAWDLALSQWRRLPSDRGAHFDSQLDLLASDIPPMVTWGTSPQDALPITDIVPDPANAPDENMREAWTRSLAYMGLTPGTRLVDI
ncbi:MAG: 3-isopropylmalate dehydratase large subunit, partial [Alphaproteobacteria bacterium]|nr:3-isopropylmalate dehydratase large subunit [Alphaproteobacteria bacterium]